jgi:chromosome segregation ATPase
MAKNFLGNTYKLMKPLFLTGCLAVTGCADTVHRAEYDATRKNDAETIRSLRDELTAVKSDYEKSLTDLKKLVTERTSIEALIPKVGEAKEDILKQLQKDYNELTGKWNIEKNTLENSRRTTVSDLEQQKRWFKQTAEPAIGKPEDAEGPATGIYADRKKIENHETRLGNQKNAFHSLEQNLTYQRTVQEWSYSLFLEYRNPIEQGIENLQHKLDALNSVKPEERAKAIDAFERDTAAFEKNIELLYQQQREKRKKIPPRPEGEK